MDLFVGHLASAVTAEDLRRVFAGFGTVVKTIVVRDTATGRSLGHGRVRVVPERAASAAMGALQQAPLKGSPIIVRECLSRAPRDRRGTRGRWTGRERRSSDDRRRATGRAVHASSAPPH